MEIDLESATVYGLWSKPRGKACREKRAVD